MNYNVLLNEQRRLMIDVSYKARQGHLSSSMSILEVVNILYHEIMNFNIALLVGFIAGVYSSIYISNQLWLILETRRLKKPPKKDDSDKKEISEIEIKGVNC